MRVCFLGTGGSWPTRRRNVTSITVSTGATAVMLDCGEGTQRQLLGAPVSMMKIEAVLITHLHGDHFLGVPGLIQTMSLNEREKPLSLYGPPGLAASLRSALTICPFTPTFEITGKEITPDDTFRAGGLDISCAWAKHGRIKALAYRLDEPMRPGRFNRTKAIELGIPEGPMWGRLQRGEEVEIVSREGTKRFLPSQVMGPPRKGTSLVFSGDTAPAQTIVDLAKDADALVHEATFSDRFMELARTYDHSTSSDAARVAKEANVGRLFLVHSSPRYDGEEEKHELLEEARGIFRNSHLPEDLEVHEITR